MAKIYSLATSRDHSTDEYDGRFVGDKLAIIGRTNEIKHVPPWSKKTVPEKLEFTTQSANILHLINFASVNTDIDLLSRSLIETIENVGNVDWTLLLAHFTDCRGQSVCANHFCGVFINEHCDYFDYAQSVYESRDWSRFPQERVTDRMRKRVGVVKQLALREPEDGFPPCFRIMADPVRLYISEACHNAIVKAGHIGLHMTLEGDF